MMKTLLVFLLAATTLPLLAQTSPREFANGPAKWLMTAEEQRAWKGVQADDEALDFIDLFGARRDPTPGTGRNENRLEFETRVAYADANFKEGKTRGALTERGRVLVVLGFPKNMGQLKSPELTPVPEWASSRLRGNRSIVTADEHVETTVTLEKKKGGQILAPVIEVRLKGSLPLTDMDPGPYKVSLTITGAAGGPSYNLVRDFSVQ